MNLEPLRLRVGSTSADRLNRKLAGHLDQYLLAEHEHRSQSSFHGNQFGNRGTRRDPIHPARHGVD